MNRIGLRGALLLTTVAVAALGVGQDIRVTVNGDPVHFQGSQPTSTDGRVYVPLRGVFESMGANVEWDPYTRTVSAERGSRTVKITIGDKYANVDGKTLFMDAPAYVQYGHTMVPLRFLSESLGADVQWMSSDRMVAITTSGTAYSEHGNNPPVRTIAMIDSGTVIPVRLDQDLSSTMSHKGDTFMTTLDNNGDEYSDLPAGTRVEGHVISVEPKEGSNPGMLELGFDRVILPDGKTKKIDGALIGLDDNSVNKSSEGVYTAKSDKKDNRAVYAGYGAGAGLIVGLLTKKPLEGALLGGALGYILGQIQKDQRKPNDVYLHTGTKMGVRLDKDLRIRE